VVNGVPFFYLETRLRLAYHVHGVDQPIGAETTGNPSFDIEYSRTVDGLEPGNNYTLSGYDIIGLYRSALARWGLSPDVRAVLVGLEPGTEGFGVSLAVDWKNLEVQTYEPGIVRADFDFEHVVDGSDLSLVKGLVGKCPETDFGTYQWRADVDPANLASVPPMWRPSKTSSAKGTVRSTLEIRSHRSYCSLAQPPSGWR